MSKSGTVQRSSAARGTRHDTSSAKLSSSERYNAKNQTTTPHTKRRMRCFLRSTLLCIAIAGLFLFRYPGYVVRNFYGDETLAKIDDIVTGPLNPNVEKLQGLDHFYMLPPANATADGKPIGILFYFHSCKETGMDFFTLPEHRIIAYDAMLKGLVVFSPTSYDRKSGCYSTADANGFLEEVVRGFVRNHHFRRLPRVGMGHSSGGAFLPFVSKPLKLESMAVYNSPQDNSDIDNEDLVVPTVYLGMSSDTSTYNQMKDKKRRLQEMSIPSYLYKVSPRPFTKSLCHTRLPEIEGRFCDHIVETIQGQYSNLIDSDGYVTDGDLKSQQWQNCFRKLESDYELLTSSPATPEFEMKNLAQRASRSWLRVILEQEIQSCYGFHSMTAQFHSEMLDFLILNSNMEQSEALSH